MPNRTIYLRDEDVDVFEEAKELGGDSVSAVVVQALRRFVSEEAERRAREARLAEAREAREQLLARADELGAGHVHVEPGGGGYRVRVRTDGALETVDELTEEGGRHLVEHLAEEVSIEGDRGQGRLPVPGDPRLDVTVEVLPTASGPSAVLRVLRPEASVRAVDELGVDEARGATLRELAGSRSGLVIATGPSGCGKTTTLQALLARAAGPGVKAFSVEDPVERILEGVTQVPVRPARGETFQRVLAQVARCDPDVIYVSEVRDPEVAEFCVLLAATGHLVLTCLHAPTAPAALARLVDVGVKPFIVRDAVRAVIAQRLVRELCPECREEDPDGDDPRARGCEACRQQGYRGVLPLWQILEPGREVKEALTDGADAERLEEVAGAAGLTSLREEGLARVEEGRTTRSEVLRATEEG